MTIPAMRSPQRPPRVVARRRGDISCALDAGRGGQRGVVLVIALILLVVAALGSMFVMRSALLGEQVDNNLRSHTLAQRGAEIALRYCERYATPTPPASPVSAGPTPTVVPTPDGATPTAWTQADSWSSSGAAVAVPVSLLNSIGDASGISYTRPPQCLIETLPLRTVDPKAFPSSTYLVTARGFTPDGVGQVWLQSTVRVY